MKLCYLFFLISINQARIGNTLFRDKLKQIRDKAKNVYQSKFGKDKSWHFLGYDISEYPGANEKYLAKHRQAWEEYYSCLKTQDEHLGLQSTVTPEAILGFEGGTIKLECKVCLSPEERHKVDSVEWEWASEEGKHLEPIDYTEHTLVDPDDKSLNLYNLEMENTGQYLCRLGRAVVAPYFLTVINITEEKMIEVHAPDAPLGPYPKEAEQIEEYKLVLDTMWEEWSTCSKCDKIGKKHKLGYCVVFSEEHTKIPLVNVTATGNKTKENESKVDEVDLELIKMFKFGIPCDSHLLPRSVAELQQVKNRKNEIMTGFCKVKCADSKVFEVKDKDGNVIEKANNSAGIYSLLQGMPSLEPTVERRLQYETKGKKIVITCPGNSNSDAPIQWQIGDKNVVPEIISKESKGRIYVSVSDRIHIKDAKISDAGVYSCWQQKELAGTVRLMVEKKLQLNFNHHVMLVGIVIIFSVFLYVFARAFFGRKYAKI